jgi:hypothetical protein
MDRLEFGRSEIGDGIALIDAQFIRHAQFLQQPENALRTAVVEVVKNDRHGGHPLMEFAAS